MRAVMMMCALCVATATARPEQTMSDGDAAFATALHAQLRAQKGNLFYSPASVRVALAMAMAGARGTTQAELARALSLPSGPEAARIVGAQLADWDKLAPKEQAPEAELVVLRVVNRVWAQPGRKLLDAFVRTLGDLYRAPLGTVDFRQDSEGARRTINEWVAKATEQRIPALVGPGQLASDTKLMVTNAVYFKGRWLSPFRPQLTSEGPFSVGGGRTVTVPLMHKLNYEWITRVDGAFVLERRYAGDRIAMDIILPNRKDGLGAIEDAYVKGALLGALKDFSYALVRLTLPKFKLSSAIELLPALERLGVVHATKRGEADFSGIDGARDFYLGGVIHQAVVGVDEATTEAAAATVDRLPPTLALNAEPAGPIVFNADHPFFFVIRDTQAGVVLFAGRVVDPTAR